MQMMFLLLGFLSLGIGILFLSNATSGVGGIGAACFFGICARMAQAERDTKLLLAAVSQREAHRPVPPPVAVVVPAPPPEPPPPELPPQKRKHTAVLPGTGRGFFVEVAGESFYQPALRALQTVAGKEPVRVLLYPEPENTYDANAVAIKTFEGETVGYLTKEAAPRYQQTLLALRERGQVGVCAAQLVGGTDDKPSIGLFLDIEAPTHVAAELGVKYQRVQPKPL